MRFARQAAGMTRFLVDRAAPRRVSSQHVLVPAGPAMFVPWSIAPSGCDSTGRQTDTAGCRGRFGGARVNRWNARRPEEATPPGVTPAPYAWVELEPRIGHRPRTQREIAMATAVVNTLDGLDRELETVLTSFDTSYA